MRGADARERNTVTATESPAATLARGEEILVGWHADGDVRAVGERGALERPRCDVGQLENVPSG